jgi:aminoglycoside 3-N-acetyltransferase
MPGKQVPEGLRPVTRSELVRDLRALGVREGAVVMVHTAMSSLGWVVGGADAVVYALLDTVGPGGTLVASAGWHEDTYDLASWPPDWQRAYQEELPGFDPAVMEADHDNGRLPERIRTWPGARRSAHPESSVVAIGARTDWIVSPHPDDDAFGAGTPLARLVEADGQVLMLGAPLETITLLHHAEAIADVPDKRRVTYRMPVAEDGHAVWREYHDIDSSLGAFRYEDLEDLQGMDGFEAIGRAGLAAGVGRSSGVGMSTSHLFEAPELVRFAVAWMEERFGQPHRG